jgi:hypothetical protein
MTAKPKTTITGTAPSFDAAELKRLQDNYHNAYHETHLCTELIHGSIPLLLLSGVIEKASQGYKLHPRYPVSMGEMNYTCRMIKPTAMQEADLIAGDEAVKLEYIAKVESERDKFKDRLRQQLLEAAELKEIKKLEDLKAKRLADIDAEIESAFGSLVVPA